MLVCRNCARRVRLADDVGRDLQRDGTVGQVPLAGQVDAAEGPAPELGLEPEAEERAPHLGESRHGAAPAASARFESERSSVPEQLGRSRRDSTRRERGLQARGRRPRPSRYSR